MTPNSFVRLNLFMWLVKTCYVSPTVENFARVSRVHYQPKTIMIRGSDGQSTNVEPLHGCYTFAFQMTAPGPVAASKNKWSGDWASCWFYHKVPLDLVTKRHPLVVKNIGDLGDTPSVELERLPEHEAYLSVLWEVSKAFSMRDITEEYVACGCFPVKAGWTIPSWLPEEKWVNGIPVPDFAEAFQLRKERESPIRNLLCSFGFGNLPDLCFSEIDARAVEGRADEILGPESSNEYDLLLAKLGGTRKNRVFRFFKIEAPQRVAEARLADQRKKKDAGAAPRGGGSSAATIVLEKRKKRKGGSSSGASKRPKLLDQILSGSPLRSKGSPKMLALPVTACWVRRFQVSPLPPPSVHQLWNTALLTGRATWSCRDLLSSTLVRLHRF